MNTDFLDIVNDKERLHKHILFCGSFIMAYDNLISTWEQGMYFLFDNYMKSLVNGDETFVVKKPFIRRKWEDFGKYKDKNETLKCFIKCEFKALKKKHKVKKGNPLFLWMYEHHFIEFSDIKILEQSRLRRNIFAHELDNTLKHEITQDEKDLLKSLIAVSERASQNWVYRITIPSNKESRHLIDYLDEDGHKTEPKPEFLLTGTNLFYSLVLSNLEEII